MATTLTAGFVYLSIYVADTEGSVVFQNLRCCRIFYVLIFLRQILPLNLPRIAGSLSFGRPHDQGRKLAIGTVHCSAAAFRWSLELQTEYMYCAMHMAPPHMHDFCIDL